MLHLDCYSRFRIQDSKSSRQITKDEEQRTKNKEQISNGQRTTDNGQRTNESAIGNVKGCEIEMKKILLVIVVVVVSALNVLAQEKGVDSQSKTIRDAGNRSGTAANGSNPNKGLSSGINWGKDKTPERKAVDNPYRFTARRDTIVQAAQEILRDGGKVLNETASRLNEGILVTQPYVFAKGPELAQSALVRYAITETTYTKNWTRGRYTLIIEVQPIDGVHCNVSVTAKIEGKAESASGAEWTTLKSSGEAEQEFLNDLIEYVLGESPSEPKKTDN
jgi:hypothetical protein